MNTLLFKPIAKFQESTLLIFGILVAAISLFVAVQTGIRFDGAIDAHVGNDISIVTALKDLVIAIATMVLFLFIAAKIVNSKTRFIDILNTVLVARITILFLAMISALPYLKNIGAKILAAQGNSIEVTKIALNPIFLFLSLLLVVLLVWYIALLWNGFKISSNAKGGKSVVLFIIAIVSAEVTSKIILSIL